MISAHAAHRLTSQEDAIDVNVEAVVAFADHIDNLPFRLDGAYQRALVLATGAEGETVITGMSSMWRRRW